MNAESLDAENTNSQAEGAGPRWRRHAPTVLVALLAVVVLAFTAVVVWTSAGAEHSDAARPASNAAAISATSSPTPAASTGSRSTSASAKTPTSKDAGASTAAHEPSSRPRTGTRRTDSGATAVQGNPKESAPAASQNARGEQAADASGQGWEPASSLPANFEVTTPTPSVEDLNAIIHFLVATPASDAAKANNLEGGAAAVAIPQTVYRLGLFRAPKGWKRVSGPIERRGNRATATLHSASVGRPGVHLRIQFVYSQGHWKLANSSICQGVRTVGLPLQCPA